MKNLVILAFAFIASGSAFAAGDNKSAHTVIALSEAQMDTVSAGARGALVNNTINVGVWNSNNIQVIAPVNTAVAVNIGSGSATALALQQFGNITQNN